MFRLIVLFALVAAPALGQGFPAALVGAWVGTGQQEGNLRWRIEVDLRPEGAQVRYPDIPCTARWEFDAPGADHVSGVERLTLGAGLCEDGLGVMVAPGAKGGIRVQWRTPELRLVAEASLIRR